MSKFLDAVARTEFDTMVKHAYQGGSKLRDTVEYRGNVVGDTYKFRVMGRGKGHLRAGSSSLVVPMGIEHSLKTATLANWEHPEYTDIFDQAKVNFDEKSKLTETIGKAMGRTEDQIIIDTVAAGTFATTPDPDEGFSIAAAASGFTMAKLRALKAYYADIEADDEEITIAVSGTGLDRLLANTETTSADFNSVKALVSGEMNTFMGFKFVTIGSSRLEGGLGGNGLVAYAWCKSAVGLAANSVEKTMDINYVPERVSWLCNGLLSAGSVIIDPQGLAKIAFT